MTLPESIRTYKHHFIVLNVLVAFAYFMGGYAGLLLSAPPSTASPLWPPAGIALVVALLYGYRVLPGLFVGSLLIQLMAFYDASSGSGWGSSVLLASVVASGSVLQAFFARYLMQRFVGVSIDFLKERELFRFMLIGGPLACVTSASVGTLSLLVFGTLPVASAAVVWGTWWVGDSIGVIVVAPILLGFLSGSKLVSGHRLFTLTVSVFIALTLVISFFIYTNKQLEESVDIQFQDQARRAANRLGVNLDRLKANMQWGSRFYLSSNFVSEKQFERFFSEDVNKHKDVTAYYWLRQSSRHDAYQVAYETRAKSSINCVMAPTFEASFVALRSTLLVANARAGSLIQGACSRLWLVRSVVPQHDASQVPLGLLVVELDSERFFSRVLKQTRDLGMSIRLVLSTPLQAEKTIYQDSPRVEQRTVVSGFDADFTAAFFMGDASLDLLLDPDPEYVANQHSWSIWLMLVAGLVFSSLLSVFLIVLAGRSAYTNSMVKARTKDLDNEIEERKRAEGLLELQNTVLEMIARDEPLKRTLNHICEVFEGVSREGTIASVMLVNSKTQRLNIAVAPSMSKSVFEALMDFPIGDNEGSCGTAAFRGECVVVTDIANDARWLKYKDFAANEDLHACWSMPFFSKKGDVLGTFALTQTVARAPTEQDMVHLKASSFLCSVAVEQATSLDQLNKLSEAVEQSPSSVMMMDRDGRIEYVNRRFTELIQYTEEQAVGELALELLDIELAEGESVEEIWHGLLAGDKWQGMTHNMRRDGSRYWAQYYLSPVRNHDNEITHMVAIHDDVSEMRRNAEKIHYQATHDLLTGLVNRSQFEQDLDLLLEDVRQNPRVHSLCFIDLDQFKIVNDTSGHVAGDELLRQLGSLMLRHIRQRDILARMGGDEFAILLEDCDVSAAVESVNALRKAIEEHPFVWGDRTFSVGMSAGLVEINADSPSRSELLREADAACYAAKDQGRNRVHVYRDDDESTRQRSTEIHWATEIREALAEDRFVLYRQAIVATDPGSAPECCEVLLRMVSRQGDLILPDTFLPAAERFNIAPQIDAWVVEHTFQFLAAGGPYLDGMGFVSINLSGLSLEVDFAQQIILWLQEYNLPADKICLEITETAAIRNLAQAHRFIDVLREAKVKFALDDFGTGLSSFAYLKNLPVDFLKIDGQFVADMLNDPIDLAMVKSINEIGKVMGKKTIAEFVENEAILEQLRLIGVDYAQGYGIAWPEECVVEEAGAKETQQLT